MFSGDSHPIDRYSPFSARRKPILLRELRKLLSAVDETYFCFTCQSYFVLMLAPQIAWFHTSPVSVSNDRYPKSSGPRVVLPLSGLRLRKDLADLIARVVVEEHTQLFHAAITRLRLLLNLHELEIERSKPKHSVKLKWDDPCLNPVRDWHTTGDCHP